MYAEDPEKNFMPSPGGSTRLRMPHGPGVRDDGGVYEGSEVSIYYDPMISKFAVYGRDRAEAIDRMRRACGVRDRRHQDDAAILSRGDGGRGVHRRAARHGLYRTMAGAAEGRREADAVSRDMALIAAAMAFTKAPANLGQAGRSEPQTAQLSRWGVAGRAARLNRHL